MGWPGRVRMEVEASVFARWLVCPFVSLGSRSDANWTRKEVEGEQLAAGSRRKWCKRRVQVKAKSSVC